MLDCDDPINFLWVLRCRCRTAITYAWSNPLTLGYNHGCRHRAHRLLPTFQTNWPAHDHHQLWIWLDIGPEIFSNLPTKKERARERKREIKHFIYFTHNTIIHIECKAATRNAKQRNWYLFPQSATQDRIINDGWRWWCINKYINLEMLFESGRIVVYTMNLCRSCLYAIIPKRMPASSFNVYLMAPLVKCALQTLKKGMHHKSIDMMWIMQGEREGESKKEKTSSSHRSTSTGFAAYRK